MSDGDDSGMEEYGTEWLAGSSEMFDFTIRSSSNLLFDVGRLKLNELAIALSEELTLEAEKRLLGQNWLGWERKVTFGFTTGAKFIRGVTCRDRNVSWYVWNILLYNLPLLAWPLRKSVCVISGLFATRGDAQWAPRRQCRCVALELVDKFGVLSSCLDRV